jgi:DNA invertase Pin-like site-specific DNA recombinase
MRIGYARVSTEEQSLDLQIDALTKAGCDQIFKDHGISGVAPKRPGLEQALAALHPGDTLVVWRLDRLARSMQDLLGTVQALHEREVGFQSICEHIDISSAFGELILHVLSAVVHFERRLIVERTEAGMRAAKARGVRFGRRRTLDEEGLSDAIALQRSGMPIPEIAKKMGVGRSTLYRHIALGYEEKSARILALSKSR